MNQYHHQDGMASEIRRSGSSGSRRSSAGSTDAGRAERRRHRSSNLSSASTSANAAGRYSPSQTTWYSPTSSPAFHSPSSSSFTSVDSVSTALTLPSPEVQQVRVLMIMLDTHHPLISEFVEPESVKEFVLELLSGVRDELAIDLSCLFVSSENQRSLEQMRSLLGARRHHCIGIGGLIAEHPALAELYQSITSACKEQSPLARTYLTSTPQPGGDFITPAVDLLTKCQKDYDAGPWQI